MAMVSRIFLAYFFIALGFASATPVVGRVVELLPEARSVKLELLEGQPEGLDKDEPVIFRVGPGDLEIGYLNRTIRAEAVFYNKHWFLERVFPIDGDGSKAAADLNARLHDATAVMSRRKYLREGDYVPNFGMINQQAEFVQIKQLQGKPFVLNFIFTRCTVPTMCPASTQRMSDLQEHAAEAGLKDLQFATISFDPDFDSPGVLRQYAKGYGIESDNFQLLTYNQSVVDDILRQFGILTVEEDGTINHTMATFLIDANGRIAYRKEGSGWTVEDFMKAAQAL